jgi:superfamily I DNA/RNA helicase
VTLGVGRVSIGNAPWRMLGVMPRRARDLEPSSGLTGQLTVLAGAGIGKATVVVERIHHLLDTLRSLTPEHFLILTYSVGAAGNLFDRHDEMLDVVGQVDRVFRKRGGGRG